MYFASIAVKSEVAPSVTSTDPPKGMWNRIDPDHLGERCSEQDEPRIAASTCPAIDSCDASVLMPR